MSKRTSSRVPHSVSKSSRTDFSLKPAEVIQSPYFSEGDNSNDKIVKEPEIKYQGDGETVERRDNAEEGERTDQVSQGTSSESQVLWSDGGGRRAREGQSNDQLSRMRLSENFYDQDCITLAKALLGERYGF